MLQDPRYTTSYAYQYRGPLFHRQDDCNNILPHFLLPASTMEKWCRPGYQPERPNKGSLLLINYYPYHPIEYDKTWSSEVYSPLERGVPPGFEN